MKFLLLSISIFFSSLLFSQSGCDVRIVDSLEYAQIETLIQTSNRSLNVSSCNSIRVVVHVVYDGAIQDNTYNGHISAEQVKSQIRITNQFFANDSLMASDESTPLGYKLKLAEYDPEGNPTTGIIYHDGAALFGENWSNYGLKNNNPNAISSTTLSNAIAWGADLNGKKYLNSYVVSSMDGNAGGGVQAFAYFPTGNVVFGNYNLFNTFGSEQLESEYNQVFNLKSYTDLGFTFTHELLHNFAIYHTFQGNSCAEETDPNWQGDRVADTAPQTQGSGCSGACGSISYNVMDYLSQGCKNRITPGQVERANSAIQNSLADYLVCSDCDGKTSDFNLDGGINVLDYSLFGTAFGCSIGTTCYQDSFDLNCDGFINLLDLSLIGN